MTSGEQLSKGRMGFSLAIAAVAGLASYIALMLGSEVVERAVATLALGAEWKRLPDYRVGIVYFVFGLPIALVLSLAVGFPIWKRAEARTLRSRRSAWIMGATTGAAIGLLLTFVSFLAGLHICLDDTSSANAWRYGYQVTRDGLPTLLGWLFEFVNVIYLALAGTIGGVTARWVALSAVSKR